MNSKFLIKKSKEIRNKTIEYHKKNKIEHLGCCLSSVEIITTLYYSFMKKADCFILSKGHACGVHYVILNDIGHIPDKEIDKLEGHPTLNKKYGIEATTGSLGQGISVGLGMAIADKNNRIFVLMGDGECDEGQVWEAVRTASELNVQNLICLVDCNGLQGFKSANHTNLDKKFKSFGWEVRRCDGHNCNELLKALNKDNARPLVILANTVKGKGIPRLENKLKSHYVSC
jgi:transketolase